MIKEKVCNNCKKIFIPKKNDARIKFCHEDCRKQFRNKMGYNKKWHKENKEWVKEYRKKTSAHRNERRRERYQNDEKHRKKVMRDNKKYREKNPDYKKNADLLYNYGITINDFRDMKSDQKSRCKICGTHKELESELYVDHCHATGKVRGLLCNRCNFGIGQFQDDIELLKKAIHYLEED